MLTFDPVVTTPNPSPSSRWARLDMMMTEHVELLRDESLLSSCMEGRGQPSPGATGVMGVEESVT